MKIKLQPNTFYCFAVKKIKDKAQILIAPPLKYNDIKNAFIVGKFMTDSACNIVGFKP